LQVAEGPLQGLELEVIGFQDCSVLAMPLSASDGLEPGTRLCATGGRASVPVGDQLLGRVLDAQGRPIDSGGPLAATVPRCPLDTPAVNAMQRLSTPRMFRTGIRVVDQLLALGEGQRIGVFAASGLGKTTLLAMLARGSEADVNVVALIGERGREVRPFVEKALGYDGLARSVVVVATSDEPAVRRVRAAFAAAPIAQSFQSQGRRVLLLMDSLSRFALAQRELGLAAGEPQTTRGYTPSVFAALSRLLERAGYLGGGGSITAAYSVLLEADPLADPLAEALQALLDGHLLLSPELARAGHYPAVDPLNSLSRLMDEVLSATALARAAELRELLAAHHQAADLLAVGAYRKGTDDRVDKAVRLVPPLRALLRQRPDEPADFEADQTRLQALLEETNS
jgi:flagellum-specific ATP synthase/type III secretion protein N (ATPase)